MFEEYGINTDYIIIGLIGIAILSFILTIVFLIRISRLNKQYRSFMSGNDGNSLEKMLADKLIKLNEVAEENNIIKLALKKLDDKQKLGYQKMGLVKYDAFKENSGKLSFVLTLLDERNNGFILNSVYSTRNGCYVYMKEIINGESYNVLTEEEKTALTQAIGSNELYNNK